MIPGSWYVLLGDHLSTLRYPLFRPQVQIDCFWPRTKLMSFELLGYLHVSSYSRQPSVHYLTCVITCASPHYGL